MNLIRKTAGMLAGSLKTVAILPQRCGDFEAQIWHSPVQRLAKWAKHEP